MDWIERGILISLAFMVAYTVFVLVRFLPRYYLARRESRTLVNESWRAFERGHRGLIADLRRGLGTLKAITTAAPLLGLAGTSYGILASLSVGFSLEKNTALRILSVTTAAALITAAAGILVAIPAILVHNFLLTRIDGLGREFSSSAPAAAGFRIAQTLPLKARFSSLPPFALIAAPALASVIVMFMVFEPYERASGLYVRLLPLGSVDGGRTTRPVVISVIAGVNRSPVIRVNSKVIPLSNLNEALHGELKLLAEPQAYVEASSSVPWADVTNVIDVLKGLHTEVVLITATPDASSTSTERAEKHMQ